MIIPDFMIELWATSGGVEPFNKGHINPASLDLTWSGKAKLAAPDPVKEGDWIDLEERDDIILRPGRFYLLDTTEYLKVPKDWSGNLMLKSSIARLGVEHSHAGFFDPGFEGTATLEIHVISPWSVRLIRGQRIVQIAFSLMYAKPVADYQVRGRYNGQRGPTPAK